MHSNISLEGSDSLSRVDQVLILGLCSGFVHFFFLLLLFLLIVYARTVGQWGGGGRWRAAGVGGAHPADDAGLVHAVQGRRLGKRRLQWIDSFLHAVLRRNRSRVALPHRRCGPLRVVVALLLVLGPSVQLVIEGNDVGDLLFPPALFPQHRV